MPDASDSLLAQVRVVLYEPQDPINIGATVRAMKNMGVQDLRLVRPVPYEANRIEQVAHDTRDVVARIRHFDDLDSALADCVRVAAFSARRRAAKWTRADPRRAAGDLLEWAERGPVALLFGREDHGLPNEALDRSQLMVTIPTSTHASLNLAQAVLVALYELHVGAGDATRRMGRHRKHAPAATAQQLELTYADAERSLVALDFFRTRNPEHVMRSLRSLLSRAAPDAREIELVRAMTIEVRRTIDRVRRELGGEPAEAPPASTRPAAGASDA
ncbi:MAG TPA: TrmJ/YjtD family RNA methyltransferase [Gemmatimonadaceae bacterium]|jgi:tRNA/rRNA methyltransferase/tRNA (cytidine32/uridine32-2'-O)-methyltransferase